MTTIDSSSPDPNLNPTNDAIATTAVAEPTLDDADRDFWRAWLPQAQTWLLHKGIADPGADLQTAEELLAWAVAVGSLRPRTKAEARFWRRVVKQSEINPEARGNHWLWIGARAQGADRGVPVTRWGPEGERQPAARIAWELVRGALPENASPRRSCEEERCINPWHYRLGGAEPDEGVATVTLTAPGMVLLPYTCPRGHKLPPMLWLPNQRPVCPVCAREAKAARLAARREGQTLGRELAAALGLQAPKHYDVPS